MKVSATYLLFAAALFGAPMLFAQEQPKGGEAPAPSGTDIKEKSDEEVKEQFERLAKEISKGMGKLEGEIARASLPPRSAAELKAELDAMIRQLGEGEKVKLNEGLQHWLAEDAARLAEILGVTTEEAAELLKNQSDLLAKLSKRTAELQASLEKTNGIQKVLEEQLKAEEKIAELIKKQEDQAKALNDKMDEILETAYELRDRAPP